MDWGEPPENFDTYADRDIYNAVETGLFHQLLPAKTLAAKSDKCIGAKLNEECVMLLVCANANGFDKRELYVIGKAKKPRGFSDILSFPVKYVDNKKA